MAKSDEFQLRAAECQQMANTAVTGNERPTSLDMAGS